MGKLSSGWSTSRIGNISGEELRMPELLMRAVAMAVMMGGAARTLACESL